MDKKIPTRKSRLPVIAGVLCVISVVPRMAGSIFIFVFGWLGDGVFNYLWYGVPGMPNGQFTLITIAAAFVFIVSLLTIIGAIYSIKKRKWVLVLTGAIISAILAWPVGVPALILTVYARKAYRI
ncbi:hypothetical protein ACFLXC_02620 [Chloroflexota bacterium]